MKIRIKKQHPEVQIPQYQTKGAAGFDLHAFFTDGTQGRILAPGERNVIGTKLVMEIPEGYELQIRPRSGLAAKKGITVLNTPGTIDSDYRGEIGIILINTSDEDVSITQGERIAQGVIAPIIQAEFEEVEELSNTERGEGGFGSTKI